MLSVPLALPVLVGSTRKSTGGASGTQAHVRFVCAGGLGVLLVCVFDRCACDSLQAESEDDPQCDGVNQPGPSKFQ